MKINGIKYDDKLANLVITNKKARERYYKNRTVAYTLQQKFPTLKEIPLDKLQKVVKEAGRLDRQWRKLLELNEEYRGRDYGYKKIAEQKYQIELGYEVGYYQDIKKK